MKLKSIEGELGVQRCLLLQSIIVEDRNARAHGVDPNSVCASENEAVEFIRGN